MFPHLIAILALSAPASADTVSPVLPLRCTTYVVDDKLTQAPVENFLSLEVDPQALIAEMKPVAVRKTLKKAKRPRVVLTRDKVEIGDNVYFQTGSFAVKEESFGLLDDIVKVLEEHPEVTKLSIEGHTDSRGGEKANRKLSQGRASAVKDYLVSKGISAKRLVSQGFGESKPLVDEENEAAWEKNRRVEFNVKGWDESLATVELVVPPTEIEVAETGTAALPIENQFTSYADVTVNGKPVGRIGVLTNGAIRGVPVGYYDVALTFQNGFEKKARVHTTQIDIPLIPGGEDARVSADEGLVPSWHDDPAQGYHDDEAPFMKAAGKKKP